MINISGRNKSLCDLQESFGAMLSNFVGRTLKLWNERLFVNTFVFVWFYFIFLAWGWAPDDVHLGTRQLHACSFSFLLNLISTYLTRSFFFFFYRWSSSWPDIITLILAKCSRAPSGGRTRSECLLWMLELSLQRHRNNCRMIVKISQIKIWKPAPPTRPIFTFTLSHLHKTGFSLFVLQQSVESSNSTFLSNIGGPGTKMPPKWFSLYFYIVLKVFKSPEYHP